MKWISVIGLLLVCSSVDAQMGRTDYFQFIVVAINKVTMEYQSGVLVAKDWAIYPSEMTGGRCTEV